MKKEKKKKKRKENSDKHTKMKKKTYLPKQCIKTHHCGRMGWWQLSRKISDEHTK